MSYENSYGFQITERKTNARTREVSLYVSSWFSPEYLQ